MESPEEYEGALIEGSSLEFFYGVGIFLGLFFILFSNVSSGLLFCAIELFQLLVLTAGEDETRVPPRFKIILELFEFVV